ncbi:unnamed protein product [Ectocarpus sp. 12 AP-2014]
MITSKAIANQILKAYLTASILHRPGLERQTGLGTPEQH